MDSSTSDSAPRRDPAGTAIAAVTQSRRALDAGSDAEAVRWLRRAESLAPHDETVQLLLASAMVRMDPEAAAAILAKLVERLPRYREASMALCSALVRARRPDQAAAALGAMLGQASPLDDPGFQSVAASVCSAAGAPGWVGLDGSGTAHLWLAGPAPGAVRLALDGVESRLRMRPGQRAIPLPDPAWRRAAALTAECGGHALIGSGLQPWRFGLVEGFAAATLDGGVTGWARLPADGGRRPLLYIGTAVPFRTELQLVADERSGSAAAWQPPRWRFTVPASATAGFDQVAIVDTEGRSVWGSPLLLRAEQRAASAASRSLATSLGRSSPAPGWTDPFRPLPASLVPPPSQPGGTRKRRVGCDVVVPVYGGPTELELCLASLRAHLPAGSRLVLVNDGSPDPAVAACLDRAAGPGVAILAHDRPRGFPAAVNTGLAHLGAGAERDVVILNADTVVGPRWLERLSAVAQSDPAIGSVTPLTNDGTIVSYPTPGSPGAAPGPAALADLNRLCWAANGAEAVTIPSGVGFCMLLKGACLAEVGPLRDDVFAQGYGEENDWCMRAAHLGWRHVAAPGVFVAHSGGRSFGAAKALLIERNAAVLERLHPGYDRFVDAALARQPLRPARRRIDRAALLASTDRPAIALVTHDAGGGVARHVARRCAEISACGRQPIVLSPAAEPGVCEVAIGAGSTERALPNLRFALPSELDALAALLQEARVEAFELHHLLRHDPSVTLLAARLVVPYDVVIHDYGHWCPRISLTGRGLRYCGEPLSAGECEECIADLGSRYGPEVTVRALRQHSATLLGGARRVAVSCADVATRIRRQFPGVAPVLVPWEDPVAPDAPAAPPAADGVHVLLVGAIGTEKGYEVLLGCARDAARRDLPLRFTVVGHTIDDDRLMATGRVFVTGRFEEGAGLALALEQRAAIGFVPSVGPETWCYALSLLWQAGLSVLGFELGAQGERIARSGRGWLLPLGLSPAKVNDALVSRGLPIVQASASNIPH